MGVNVRAAVVALAIPATVGGVAGALAAVAARELGERHERRIPSSNAETVEDDSGEKPEVVGR
jgi:hypothetical protein